MKAEEPTNIEDLFARVVDEYTKRPNRGESPSVSEYAKRYPEIAAELRDVLGMLSAIRPPAGTSQATEISAPGARRDPGAPPHVSGFVVERELGRGGMGVVYLARQVHLNRPVALKMVLAGVHSTPDERVRFLAEAEVIARLQHPHVVQVYEFRADDEGRPFFALEYLPNGSLADRLRVEPMVPAEAARLIATVAGAVGYAHELHVIHRDLKPANILFAADGTPKVTDFGLARLSDGSLGLTATGALIGTPSYMARSRPPPTPAGSGRRRTCTRWARSSTNASPGARRSAPRPCSTRSTRSAAANRSPFATSSRPFRAISKRSA